MHTQSKLAKLKFLAVAGSLFLSLTTVAPAQSDAVRAIYVSAANVPTNIPDIRTYAEPPKGFKPGTASDVELATYGFPPRPDKQADPDRYRSWEQAMRLAKTRWNGELKMVPSSANVRGERGTVPAISSPLPQDSNPNGPQYQSNVNAAGVIVTNKQTKWSDKGSFYIVSAIISVPNAELPSGSTTCTYDFKEFSFAGIDNSYENLTGNLYTLTPGLQGGVYGDVPCNDGAAGTPFYFTELGWGYPLTRGFAVNPGDVVDTFVQAEGGSTNASVYIEDETSQVYETYSVATPGIIGHNAGWIVFRPCCTAANNPFPLANTVAVLFDEAMAQTGNSEGFGAGSQAKTTLILEMTDDMGSDIETVNQGSGGLEGKYALNFNTTGCAYQGGCTP